MQQISRSIYLVEAKEIVTVEVDAVKVGNFVTFSLDGASVDPSSNAPITYTFKVTVDAGLTHFGMASSHFPTSAPDDAMYQIYVSGDKGGDRFTGSDIKKPDLLWRRGIEFRRA